MEYNIVFGNMPSNYPYKNSSTFILSQGSRFFFFAFQFYRIFFLLSEKSQDLKILCIYEILDYFVFITLTTASRNSLFICRKRSSNNTVQLCQRSCWYVLKHVPVRFILLQRRTSVLGGSVGIFDTIAKTWSCI